MMPPAAHAPSLPAATHPAGRPLVSVVIVNWNGRKHLDGCLSSLLDQDYEPLEIVLVDNGSDDGSVAFVSSRFPQVHVIALPQNTGFAAGNNTGIRASRGDIIVLINNDTKALPGLISAFVAAMTRNPRLGAAQAKIRLMRQPDVLDGGSGSYFTTTGFLKHMGHLDLHSSHTRPRTIFSAKGACLSLRRRTLAATGLFDPLFFAYFEDADLCWRTWLSGYSVEYVPDAEILHALGSSNQLGGRHDHLSFATVNFHSFKNRIRALIKNLGTRHLLLVLPVHLMLCAVLIVAYTVRRRPRIAGGIAAAILWNARHLGSSLRERRRIQRFVRRTSDEAIFRQTQAPIAFGSFLAFFIEYTGATRSPDRWFGRRRGRPNGDRS